MTNTSKFSRQRPPWVVQPDKLISAVCAHAYVLGQEGRLMEAAM
jgi:hypothetical protein